jgi:NADPH:quinone reductase-like Zn-dependent oxidoreductase
MKAVVMRDHGGPEVLELQEIERPAHQPDELLIRVAGAGLNPVDTQVRAGSWVPNKMGDPPMILGWDVAGAVEEVGRAVSGFAPGDRVFGMPRFPALARADAEYVAAPATQIAHAPDALSDEAAGALPLAGLTAWHALVDTARVGEGDRVFVQAAAGGVGHLAVQIAKALGAHVIGTARADKHDFLRELGVDEPVDYSAGPIEDEVSEVDVVIDTVSEDDAGLLGSLATLRKGGTLVVIAGDLTQPVKDAAAERDRRATEMLVHPDQSGLKELAALAAEGQLRVVVEESFPFERAPEAHERLESGRVQGKLVLTPASRRAGRPAPGRRPGRRLRP